MAPTWPRSSTSRPIVRGIFVQGADGMARWENTEEEAQQVWIANAGFLLCGYEIGRVVDAAMAAKRTLASGRHCGDWTRCCLPHHDEARMKVEATTASAKRKDERAQLQNPVLPRARADESRLAERAEGATGEQRCAGRVLADACAVWRFVRVWW